MEDGATTTRKELFILLCHYLKQKYPKTYTDLSASCSKANLVPAGCKSIEEALSVRYSHFPPDQYIEFIKSLRPPDDYPSIFRRIVPFPSSDTPSVKFSLIHVSKVYAHRDCAFCVAIDPTSQILATGSNDSLIHLWKIPELEPIRTLRGHTAPVTSISINSLSTMLLSSSDDRSLNIFSLEDGTLLSNLNGFTASPIHYSTFSPSGSLIVAACDDGSVPIWSTANALAGKPPGRIIQSPLRKPVYSLSFSPGGEFLIFSGESSTVTLVPLKTMAAHKMDFHQGPVPFVSFSRLYYGSPSGVSPRVLTSSHEEGAAAIWELEGSVWKPKYVFKNVLAGNRKSQKILRIAWDNKERLLVIARTNGVYICDSYSGESIGQLPASPISENCTVLKPNPVYQSIFFIANSAGLAAIVDVFSQKVVSQISPSEPIAFTDAVWSSTGDWVYAVDFSGGVSSFFVGPQSGFFCNSSPFVRELYTDKTDTFTDRLGKPYDPQPIRHDIRELSFDLKRLQSPLLRNSAIELRLIKQIISGEASGVPQPPTNSVIPEPPLHIPVSSDLPINPLGPAIQPRQIEKVGDEDKVGSLVVQSDTDDWDIGTPQAVQEEESPVDISDGRTSFLIQSNDLPTDHWNEWVTAVSSDGGQYIPQIGDEVIFIKNLYDDKLPLGPITRALIIDFDNREQNFRLLLRFCNTELSSLWITYSFGMGLRPIIPILLFKSSLKIAHSLNPGDPISAITEKGKKEGTVKKVNDGDPLKSVLIEIAGVEIAVSPWEILSVRGSEVERVDAPISMVEVSQSMSASIDSLLADPKFAQFHSCPDLTTHPEYETIIKAPMSLSFLKERLDGSWYRSVRGIANDILLFSKNANICDFGDPNIGEKASQLVELLTNSLCSVIDSLMSKRPKGKN